MEYEVSESDKLKAATKLNTSIDAYIENQTVFIKKIDKSLSNQKIMLRVLSGLMLIGVIMGIYLIVLGNGFNRLNKEKELFVRLKVVQDSSNTAREQANVRMMANIFKQDSIAKLKNVIKANVVNTHTVNTVNANKVNVSKNK